MSLLFIDGFDHLTTMSKKWDGEFFAGSILPVAGTGRFGGQALQIKGSGGGGTRTKNLPASTEIIAGFGIRIDPTYPLLGGFTTSTSATAINFSATASTGVVSLQTTYGTGHTISTPPSTVTSATWFFLELRAKLHASLGELEIKINGVSVASITGVDTLTGSGTGIIGFYVGASNNLETAYIDDLYILDTLGTANNTFIGDSRVTTHYPVSAGTESQFTPFGAATNYGAVNETIFDGDSTYVESGVLGAKDNYNNQSFSDLGVAPGTIFGVQVVNASLKTDAASLKYRDQMIIAGVAYDTGVDTVATATDYKMTTYITDTDPSDDTNWTESKVAAVGSGIEITFRQI